MSQTRVWLLDFLDSTHLDHRALQLLKRAILQEKVRMITKAIHRSSGLPPQFQRVGPSHQYQQARGLLPVALGLGAGLPRALGTQHLPSIALWEGSPPCRTLEEWPPPSTAAGPGQLFHWVWKTGRCAKDDYSLALRSNGICPCQVLDLFKTCHFFLS